MVLLQGAILIYSVVILGAIESSGSGSLLQAVMFVQTMPCARTG